MDIRKYIIILCLLCCHAIGVMADGKPLLKYVDMDPVIAKILFNFRDRDNSINVKSVSYGEYDREGNVLFGDSRFSKNQCFAFKVKLDKPGYFSFQIQEVRNKRDKNFYYKPSYKHTVIVDGKPSMLPELECTTRYEYAMYQLSAGEHEIVIQSNYLRNQRIPTLSLLLSKLLLHAHTIDKIVDQRPAICGQDGYIKRTCSGCTTGYEEVETFPMPAKEHKFNPEINWQNSCAIPSSAYRDCLNCGLSEYKIRGHKSHTHDFQNGQCVKEGCKIKMPVKNDAGIYQVGDAYQLRGLSEYIALGNIPRDCNIDLTADIVYPADLAHLPIGTTDYPFAGTFDGHGHSVGNMQTPVLTDIIGLFGVVNGTPRRFAVIANVVIDSTSTLKAIGKVGGVAGWAEYCDIVRCVNRATIIGDNNVGGIVGYSECDCHLIDCAGLGIINSKINGGLLSGTIRQGYIMDSYGSGSFANKWAVPLLAPIAGSPLRHCFQLDAKAPETGVTSFSSVQLSDGTLARMLCEKNGKDMPAHWQQGAKEGCPMPIFVALTDRPASVIQPQSARAEMSVSAVNPHIDEENGEEDWDEDDWDEDEDEDEEWYSFTSESDIMDGSPEEDFILYDEADSTMGDFACYVSTTYRNVPAMPMFSPMLGGDATECDVTYAKKDSTVILEYNYMTDGKRYSLTDATKLYMTPDSVVHVERYDVERIEDESEFLMTSNVVYFPDNSGYEEKVSYGVSTRVMDWAVVQAEDMERSLNYYFYDEEGQQRVDFYSIPLSDKGHDNDNDDDNEDFEEPFDMDYTLDEFGRLKDIHYVLTDSITGEQYNIGGQYYIYDEQGELVQAVSYEPVALHSSEMYQTEYTLFESYNAGVPTSIIPIEQLQPGTLNGTPTRISTHVYDMRGNLVRLNNDANALKSLPKGIYITRGKKILVR